MKMAKAIIRVILLYACYRFLVAFVFGFFQAMTQSDVFSTLIAELFFGGTYIYVLCRRTLNIKVNNKESASSMPYTQLMAICVIIVAICYTHAALFSPFPLRMNFDGLTIAEKISRISFLLLIGPILEEVVYRQWMISYLEKREVNTVCSIVLSSLLFFYSHVETVDYLRFDSLVAGIILSLVYIKYHNIKYCICIHVFSNFVLTSIFVFHT